eukprot:jgi/Botrbrau1/419/Bobra.110_2s0069.1
MSGDPRQFSASVDWGFMNFLACIFDSLDTRRDGDVELKAFLGRLAGYDPVASAPLEVLEARLKEAEDPLHPRHGHGRAARQGQRGLSSRAAQTGNTALMPGVVRLTGAGYIGSASNAPSRTPVLTLQQQELFVKVNDQVGKLLAFYHVATGAAFSQRDTDLQHMVAILATFTGAAHREAFVKKLGWPKGNYASLPGLLS